MVRFNQIILIALIATLISGCTSGQDVTPVVKAIPEVQQFLKEHPNAKITVTYWSKEDIAKLESEISRQCYKSIQPVAMYKATISEGDIRSIAWIDAETKTAICTTIEGKDLTTAPTLTPVVISTPVVTSTPEVAHTPTATSTLEPTPTPTPEQIPTITPSVSIYISAVQFDAPGNKDRSNLNGEWVKITNSGRDSITMTSWKLSDEGSKHVYVFPSFVLSPGATVTIFTGSGTNTATELYMGRGAPIWNNDGDTAILRDANGNIIDQRNE